MGKDSAAGLSLTQIALVVGVALAVYLLVYLGLMAFKSVLLRRLVAEQDFKQQTLQADLDQLDLLLVELEQGAGLDEWVEEWAREERHLVREGDVPIIVDLPGPERSGGGMLSRLTGTKPPPSRPHWHEWRDLFVSP